MPRSGDVPTRAWPGWWAACTTGPLARDEKTHRASLRIPSPSERPNPMELPCEVGSHRRPVLARWCCGDFGASTRMSHGEPLSGRENLRRAAGSSLRPSKTWHQFQGHFGEHGQWISAAPSIFQRCGDTLSSDCWQPGCSGYWGAESRRTGAAAGCGPALGVFALGRTVAKFGGDYDFRAFTGQEICRSCILIHHINSGCL